MRKLLFIAVAFLVLLTGCSKKEEISISKIAQQLASHQSFSFDVTEKYYYSNTEDTIVTDFEVWTVRDKNDTLRKGYVWVDNKYRPYNMIYETGHFFLVIPPKKTTVLYSNFREPFISSIDWIDTFLKPESLEELDADTNVSIVFSDTKYQHKPCAKMEITFKHNGNKVYEKHTYYLDNELFVPLWAKLESFRKGYVYTEELFFSDYEFDQVDIDILKEMRKELIKENKLERAADSKISRVEKLLHIGDKAPIFSGKRYSTGKKFSLADYIGKKIIIVDFWYTHCPPCVRAMPYLSDLYKEYEEKGLIVLGLNSVDNQPRSMDGLNSFLSKRNLSYPVILTNPSVDIIYKINGYPTMYIIDLDGNIAFVEMGFDKERFEMLKARVDEMVH
jgi:thiol-disulfide isomerase/thioredoxin/outer membrane lipoprotein-sorting protein